MFLSLSPVTAALGGAVLLGEEPPLAALAGLVAVSAGLWLALKPSS
jgi:drug/metabolite transporter (DMT)-like permease